MLSIPQKMLEQIIEQAEREYPSECCGMIFGPQSEEIVLSKLRPCHNVYDKYHELDPNNFPRTSATAYFIDPRELLAIQKETRENQEMIRIIYHSHINAGAYFSEEDHRVAAPEGEPAYPGVEYLVVSVRDRQADDHRLFQWNNLKKKYISTS